jgi:transcriptional regulator with XRE-family HTH domain
MTDAILADLLKGLRADVAEMSQEALAKEMNARGFSWHVTTTNKIEKGARRLTATEIFAIAEIFGINLADFDVHRVRELILNRQRERAAADLADAQARLAQIDAELRQ